jgi:hypothetical protein
MICTPIGRSDGDHSTGTAVAGKPQVVAGSAQMKAGVEELRGCPVCRDGEWRRLKTEWVQ